MVRMVAIGFALAAMSAGAQAAPRQAVVESEPMFFAYPAAAYAAGEEGRVGVELAVAADGRVERCQVVKPVTPSLDEASCRFWTRTRFRAAFDEQGQPVPSTVQKFSDWRLR